MKNVKIESVNVLAVEQLANRRSQRKCKSTYKVTEQEQSVDDVFSPTIQESGKKPLRGSYTLQSHINKLNEHNIMDVLKELKGIFDAKRAIAKQKKVSWQKYFISIKPDDMKKLLNGFLKKNFEEKKMFVKDLEQITPVAEGFPHEIREFLKAVGMDIASRIAHFRVLLNDNKELEDYAQLFRVKIVPLGLSSQEKVVVRADYKDRAIFSYREPVRAFFNKPETERIQIFKEQFDSMIPQRVRIKKIKPNSKRKISAAEILMHIIFKDLNQKMQRKCRNDISFVGKNQCPKQYQQLKELVASWQEDGCNQDHRSNLKFKTRPSLVTAYEDASPGSPAVSNRLSRCSISECDETEQPFKKNKGESGYLIIKNQPGIGNQQSPSETPFLSDDSISSEQEEGVIADSQWPKVNADEGSGFVNMMNTFGMFKEEAAADEFFFQNIHTKNN